MDYAQSKALALILRERQRQEAKWGPQNHHPGDWMLILGEEYGELQKEVLEKLVFPNTYGENPSLEPLLEEAVQVAAVALSVVESLLRNECKDLHNA